MKFFILIVCLFGTVFAQSHPVKYKPLPVDDSTVIKLANQAVAKINAEGNGKFYNKLIEIKEARSKLRHSKITYTIKVILRKTYSHKSKPYTDACGINDTAPPKLCTIDAYVRVGSDESKIVILRCETIHKLVK
uniref:Cystatin domain-containing protein n=1 Tax=Tetranychus urticae TaxID=32264 RepID=T1JW11_TETUR